MTGPDGPNEMTPEKAKKLRYGAWGGNPKGDAYIAGQCVEQVSDDVIRVYRQCARKNGYGPHGLYCKRHSPEAATAREEARERKYQEWLAAKSAPSAEVVALRRLRDAVLATPSMRGLEFVECVFCKWVWGVSSVLEAHSPTCLTQLARTAKAKEAE